MPKVGVVIACFNPGRHLDETVGPVASQTRRPRVEFAPPAAGDR